MRMADFANFAIKIGMYQRLTRILFYEIELHSTSFEVRISPAFYGSLPFAQGLHPYHNGTKLLLPNGMFNLNQD